MQSLARRLEALLLLRMCASTAAGPSVPTVMLYKSTQVFELNPSVQHIPLHPLQSELRPPPAHVPRGAFEIHVGSSVYRDGHRCGKTLFTALKRAVHPERLRFGILEQVVPGDAACLDEYCTLAAAEWPDDTACRYKNQIQVITRPAAEASGCTTARHQQQKMIGTEEFCLQVDGHSIFTNGWDEMLLKEWQRTENEMAILTVYPHDLHDFIQENGDNNAPNWIPHLCTIIRGGNSLPRIPGASNKRRAEVPQLGALWGGGLSFSKCHAERNVPVDSHTPWLWDGEEFLRSIDYWTHGYDLYSPSKLGTVIYHNYSQKPANFWKGPIDPATKAKETEMTHNRVRLRLGIGFKGRVDAFELDKYKFGTARTLQQYLEFANTSLEGDLNATHSCRQLHWVPYSNASEVEEIVGNGWRMIPVPAPMEPAMEPAPAEEVDEENGTTKLMVQEMTGGDHLSDEVVQAMNAREGNEAGKDEDATPSIRQGLARRAPLASPMTVAWGLLAIGVLLVVMLSNDPQSQAIRQCFIMTVSGSSQKKRGRMS